MRRRNSFSNRNRRTSFNPFIGPKLLHPKNGDHTILRTTEDFASLAVAAGGNYKVKSVHPHIDKINPIEAHRLENFTQTSTRRPGITEGLIKSLQNQGEQAGEFELIHSIAKAQEQGLSFTDWLHEFNGRRGADTTPDGRALAGQRVHSNSKMVRFWAEAKASGSSTPAFTPQERNHITSCKYYSFCQSFLLFVCA